MPLKKYLQYSSQFIKTHVYKQTQMFSTWSSMLLTPSGPSKSMAWPMRSVRPQLSIRKPKSRWNLSVAALESRRLKELKQHSGLVGTQTKSKAMTQDSESYSTFISSWLMQAVHLHLVGFFNCTLHKEVNEAHSRVSEQSLIYCIQCAIIC